MQKLKNIAFQLYKKHNQNKKIAIAQALILNFLAKVSIPFYILYTKSCSRHKPVSRVDVKFIGKLQEKYFRYLGLVKQAQDAHGFVETRECDSLLFTGLTSAGGAEVSRITDARDMEGYWHRRPITYPSCWNRKAPAGYEGSTISRDMLLGLFWHVWSAKDLRLAESIFNDGRKKMWVMGHGNFTRIYLTPGLQATLAEMIYCLGGPNHALTRHYPQSWSKGLDDYQLHLQLLHITLRGQMLGYVTKPMLEVIEDAHKREPNNALVRALYDIYCLGDITQSTAFLMNSTWWPENRLPESRDRKSQWLPQRKYFKIIDGKKVINPDWKLCNDGHMHSGGDFLFVAKLLLQYYHN